MGRKAKPNWYASRKAYCVTYKGIPYILAWSETDDRPNGPNWRKADERWREILDGDGKAGQFKGTVETLVASYLEHYERHKPRSAQPVRSLLGSFSRRYGKLPVADISTPHVLKWIDQQEGWASSTQWAAYAKVRALFRWAKKRGEIPRNPLAEMEKPEEYEPAGRGPEFVIEQELLALLLGEATEPFKSYLKVLALTGARPIELREAEHYHYHPAKHAIIFDANARRGYLWKNAKRKKRGDRTRRIYLNPEAEAIVAENAKRGGFLFTDEEGRKYTGGKVWRCVEALKRRKRVAQWLKEHGREPEHVIPMSFRHTFITNALLNGRNINVVADLCGTSVQMIQDTYGHAISDEEAMYKEYLRCL